MKRVSAFWILGALVCAVALVFCGAAWAGDAMQSSPTPIDQPQSIPFEQPQKGAPQGQTAAGTSTGTPEDSTFMNLNRIETALYGQAQPGGLLPRLSRAEKDLFGRELPGSLSERQYALVNFLEKGTDQQPSMLFKLAIAEWAVTQEIHPERAATQRLDLLEQMLDGSIQGGPMAMRLERFLTKLLPSGVQAVMQQVPPSSIAKVKLLKELNVKNIKKGDKVDLALASDFVVNGRLLAPKGARAFATVSKVKPPRMFGQSSEIEVEFQEMETLRPETISIFYGKAAQKAAEMDKSLLGAAGASFLGAILLGPVGLAGGFLIRGDNRPIPEGSIFYVETKNTTVVQAYEVPESLKSLLAPPLSDDVTIPTPTKSPDKKP